MPEASNINPESFNWYFGVVENRNDPMKLGRLQVRWYGVHSSDLTKQPTLSLPWATPVFPITNSSTTGIGGPWTGAVEGTFVMGFFIDSKYQKPFIMGTIAGIPSEIGAEGKAFSDQSGRYPRNKPDLYNGLNESDVSRLARNPEGHVSLASRRTNRTVSVPTAKAPEVKSVLDNKPPPVDYQRSYWDQPQPQGNEESQVRYPYNHVWETESGHIFEVDDTPGAQRINNQHRSGTFEEITADGTRTTKIKGDDYEIVARDKNVLIRGSVNLTVEGNVKTLIKGDKYEEVDGNIFRTVRKDVVEKIGGNYITEILSDRNTQINGNNSIRISGNDVTAIDGNETISVGGTHTETIVGDTTITINSSRSETVFNKYLTVIGSSADFATAKNFNIGAGTTMKIKSIGNMDIITDASQNINVAATQTISANTQDIDATTGYIDYETGSIDVSSGNITDTGITLNSHKHAGSATAPSGAVSNTGGPL